jgi:[ribosomal protein S5]-alanine N-acetyltransferase
VKITTNYFLTTERLGLRHWTEVDLPLARALWGDARVTALIGGPFSDAEVAKRLQTEMRSRDQQGVQYWPVFLLPTNEHVGCAGLRPYDQAAGILELGVHLRAEFWGMGLAEEAGRALIGHAFETLGAKGLFAGHHPDNAASQRLLSKLGFRFTHEQLHAPTGRMHPSYLLKHP